MPLDESLDLAIAAGADRLEAAITAELPTVAPRALGWLRSLTRTGRLADYFRHPSRFPMLALPWWAAGNASLDLAFQQDVVAGTMAGYYYVRLIDDFVDRQPGMAIELLPLSALLHTEFQLSYQRHFATGSPFWPLFRESWLRSADAMVPAADGSAESLLERATATIGAVVIPLWGVLLRAGMPERFEPWRSVVLELARIEQLIDDVVDWQTDFDRDLPNIIVATGTQRARSSEAIPVWVLREGYRWGLQAAKDRIAGVEAEAAALGSRTLMRFLADRMATVTALEEQAADGLSTFATLAASFQTPSA